MWGVLLHLIGTRFLTTQTLERPQRKISQIATMPRSITNTKSPISSIIQHFFYPKNKIKKSKLFLPLPYLPKEIVEFTIGRIG
jgi:hypothetical protein